MRFSLATTVAALACILSAHAQELVNRMPSDPQVVLTEREAVVLLPPELVAASLVRRAAISPDGRYVLAEKTTLRTPPAPPAPGGPSLPEPTSLILWDSRTRQSREIWRAPDGASVQQLAWLPGSHICYGVFSATQDGRSRRALLRIFGKTGRVEMVGLTELGDIGLLELSVSPNHPLAVLRHTPLQTRGPLAPQAAEQRLPTPAQALYVLTPTGTLRRSIPLPESVRNVALSWAADGSPLVRVREGEKGELRWYRLNPEVARLEPTVPPVHPAVAEESRAGAVALRLRQSTVMLPEAGQLPHLLWLESTAKTERQRALVAADVTGEHALTREGQVFYHSQGALWMRPLLRLRREQFAALSGPAADAAAAALLIREAKEIGMALLLFSREHEGRLPEASAVQESLTPYLKEPLLLDRLTFTFDGGRLPEGADPSQTEVGYLEGPGGRARIFADGSVRRQDSR